MTKQERALQSILCVAKDLREMADLVERQARYANTKNPLDIEQAGGQVVHIVLWGVANLHLETVQRDCYKAREEKDADA